MTFGLGVFINFLMPMNKNPHIIKRSVVIAGHATSVSLEPEFWQVLQKIAATDDLSIAALIRQIDKGISPSDHRNLSSAIRVYILKRLQAQTPS